MNTWVLKSCRWGMAALAIALGLALSSVAIAADRGPVEICGNTIDDDLDGFVDEAACYMGPSMPVSGDGVTPEEWGDNPTCQSIGFGYGFKIDGVPGTPTADGPPSGTYADGSPGVSRTGGAPPDPSQSVTLTLYDERRFVDWTTNFGVDAVIVKAADHSNAYIYSPEDIADTGLAGPNFGEPSPYRAISHVELCYDYELDVTKTASTSYTRTYTWTIDKSVDDESHDGFPGDDFTSNYTVTVDRTITDSAWAVTGTIAVHNPSPLAATLASVTDVVSGGIPASVTCDVTFPYVLAAGGTLTCTYEADLPNEAPRVNTATATVSAGNVGSDSGTADVTFGAPTAIVGYPTITVTDSYAGALGAASGYAQFTYSRDFACSMNPAAYTDGAYSYEYPNTATITETGQPDFEDVTLTCYAPVVTKTAEGSYVREVDWTITKEAAQDALKGFIGDTVPFSYTVTVDKTVTLRDYAVEGTISVHNPAPMPMTVTLADALNDGTPVTLLCSLPLTIPAGQTATCGYTAAPDDDSATLNTATATLNGVAFSGTADVSFEMTLDGDEAIDVVDTNGEEWATSEDASWTYSVPRDCSDNPGDYGEGTWSATYDNTATIDQTDQSASETVTLTCYAPVVTKDAAAEWRKKYDWTITKAASPTSHSGFAGEGFTSGYDVVVDQTITEYGYRASGTIFVESPVGAPGPMTVNVADMVSGGFAATVSCGGGSTSLTVLAGETGTCTYAVSLPDNADRTNTATATFAGFTFIGTANVDFGDPIVEGYPTVSVTDTVQGLLGLASGDETFEYDRTFACSTNPADYSDGSYSATYPNTATITETSQSDSESVTVTCYAPIVSKTAAASYDRHYEWTIDKSVDSHALAGLIGDEPVSEYTVTVNRTTWDDHFAVAGTIIVTNPAPMAMTVTLSDVLDDGTPVVLACNPSLTISAGQTATCNYSAVPDDASATLNTATATLLTGAGFTGTAPVQFAEQVQGYPTVHVTDSNGMSWTATGTTTWTYTKQRACSSNVADYAVDGAWSDTFDNIATIDETGASDSESVTLTCYAPVVMKDAQAFYDRTYTWQITKTAAPASHVGFAGDQFTSVYTVVVDQTVTDSNWRATGTISVQVPAGAPRAVTVNVSDVVSGGYAAVVDCGGGSTTLTVEPGTTGTCGYTVALGNAEPRTNTATATYAGFAFTGQAFVVFGSPAVIGPTEVDVTDSVQGPLGHATGDATYTYDRNFACSTDHAAYTNGTYSTTHANTATIVQTSQTDDADVGVSCWLVNVSKTAATRLTRTHHWTVEKTGSSVSFEGFPGDGFTIDYEITVTNAGYVDSDWAVSGAIVVTNPAPIAASLVAVTDVVSDGIPATVTCPVGIPYLLSAGGSVTCTYDVALPDAADRVNTATATLTNLGGGTHDYAGTAAVDFDAATITHVDGQMDVIDTFDGGEPQLLGQVSWEDQTPWEIFYDDENVACPLAQSQYVEGNAWAYSYQNTVTVGANEDTSDWTVNLQCYLPAKSKVIKTTADGDEDIGQLPFTFQLSNPQGAVVETKTLNGAGEVTFDADLEMEGTWTVTEVLPQGWVSTSQLTCSFYVEYPYNAGETFTCTFANTEMSRTSVLKLTQGVVNATKSWTFSLWEGTDGFGGDQVASDNTFGDTDGLLDFGFVNLDPYEAYTICEESVPAGWAAFWQVDLDGDGALDGTVIPYNPNADDPVPQDIGNRCVDIGDGTAVPLPVGDTLHFEVNNSYPGGEPRTPGYWKNWNRCTGGGQAGNADRNGGWQEGYWLLEDVLDPSIGGGIVWDDILTNDTDTYPITICAQAVDILDQREVKAPALVGDGKKKSSDKAYTLAMHLLAAQLNFGAGAETCTAALDAALAAERLLDELNFNGNGDYLGPTQCRQASNRQRCTDATTLATQLDSYNNGNLCP